jgi:hypothetical protein
MSNQARDVVRYIKAIEDTGGYRPDWAPVDLDNGITVFWQNPHLTVDGAKAHRLDMVEEFGSWAQANMVCAARYLKERHGKFGERGLRDARR